MLVNSTKMQLQVMLDKKVTIVTFFIVTGFMLNNYFINVFTFAGRDILDMYHPLTLLTLSTYGIRNLPFMQLYPFLIVLPAGFSYLSDKSSQEIVYIQAKVGSRSYYLGKLLAVFLLTFFVFTIPFLMEIILNSIAFPLGATGRMGMDLIHNPVFHDGVARQFLPNLYIMSPYLYTILFTLVFGLVSGILATFTVAISLVFPIKFQLFILLPIFAMLYFLSMVGQILGTNVSTNYIFYLRIFDIAPKSSLGYILILLFLMSVTAIIFMLKNRGDTL